MKKLLSILILTLLGVVLISCNNNSQPNISDQATNGGNSDNQNVEYYTGTYLNPSMVSYENGSLYKEEIADPTIMRGDDGYFYIFSTGRKMFKSDDACNFTLVTENVIPRPTWGNELFEKNPNAEVWAPDVCKVKDKWIYYYSLSGWGTPCGIGYAVADNIYGPYKDMGKMFSCDEIGIQNAIDPHVIIDDGHIYMSLGSFQGLFLIELSEDGMSALNGKEYQKKNKVHIAGRIGPWDGSTYEGSYILKKDGFYYYFGSTGTCCEGKNSTYRVVCGKAKDIKGPYVDSKGRPLSKAGNGINIGEMVCWSGIGDDTIAGAGHNSILKDDAGDYWIYYHAFSKDDGFSIRHLFIDKLEWSNGFPRISYEYVDEDGNESIGNVKPSYNIELDGPRLILK